MKKLCLVLLAALSFSQAHADDSDTPWFNAGKKVEDAISANETYDFPRILRNETPDGFFAKLKSEAKHTKLTALWGRSINFDENAKAIIVPPTFMDYLIEKFSSRPGITAREDRVVPAGVEHVYGYLFSNLSTSFGFKRARWVQPDVANGFGLPSDILSPETSAGALFTNVSYFFGRIALDSDPVARSLLESDKRVPSALKKFAYASLQGKRLVETVIVPNADGSPKKWVEIRTDFVPFTGAKGANSVLLVYSIFDSSVGGARIISGFPVAQSFMDSALNPANLGSNLPVKTRYNASVTDFPGVLNGTREVRSISLSP